MAMISDIPEEDVERMMSEMFDSRDYLSPFSTEDLDEMGEEGHMAKRKNIFRQTRRSPKMNSNRGRLAPALEKLPIIEKILDKFGLDQHADILFYNNNDDNVLIFSLADLKNQLPREKNSAQNEDEEPVVTVDHLREAQAQIKPFEFHPVQHFSAVGTQLPCLPKPKSLVSPKQQTSPLVSPRPAEREYNVMTTVEEDQRKSQALVDNLRKSMAEQRKSQLPPMNIPLTGDDENIRQSIAQQRLSLEKQRKSQLPPINMPLGGEDENVSSQLHNNVSVWKSNGNLKLSSYKHASWRGG